MSICGMCMGGVVFCGYVVYLFIGSVCTLGYGRSQEWIEWDEMFLLFLLVLYFLVLYFWVHDMVELTESVPMSVWKNKGAGFVTFVSYEGWDCLPPVLNFTYWLVAEVDGSAVCNGEGVDGCVGAVIVRHVVNVGLSRWVGYSVLPYLLDVTGWWVLWVVF